VFVGIDLGTSSVKVLLVDGAQRVVARHGVPLEVARPEARWSEQDPASWWEAAAGAVAGLRAQAPREFAAVRAIGLSGQMHGATLLDSADRVLRPAILWNDGRSAAQCAELERRAPRSREVTGNLAMPGFTAPKLLWIAEHEPEVFRRVATVLLPKDWLRLCLTGERVSEMSDAAGTLWLDVAARRWSEEMLAASGLTLDHVPRLVEGSEPSGALRPVIAEEWGLPAGVVVAGGGGDNAAGAVGVGVVRAGQAFLSLGTSGVYFVAGGAFRPNPESAVHAFCHCLPRTWHQMSVVLSAASCLTWVAAITAAPSEAALLEETERAFSGSSGRSGVVFLPYLSGERTPHNDPNATGVFFGLTHETTRAELCRAVLEGVAFALADGEEALCAAGAEIGDVGVIGGGARSRLWGRILASALGRPLRYAAEGELGPAFGAARLARLALGGESIDAVCAPPEIAWVAEPDAALQDVYRDRRELFRRLYRDLRETFSGTAAVG
jgi:xylulokinase